LKRTGGDLGMLAGEYVIYWGGTGGGATTLIGNNTAIIGSILADSNVAFGNNTTLSGDAYSTGLISGYTGGITGSIESNIAPPANPPVVDSSPYDAKIATAATYAPGDLAFAKHKTHTVSGSYFVNGNVLIDSGAVMNVTGSATIAVTGTVTLGQNVQVGNNFSIIAGGAINISNGVYIGQDNLWYSGAAITVGQSPRGDVNIDTGTVFITPGNVTINNNCTFNGFIYGGNSVDFGNHTVFNGLVVAGRMISVGDNSQLTMDAGAADWETISGFSGGTAEAEYEITDWEELY